MAAETTQTHHVDLTCYLVDPADALYFANRLILAERARAAAFAELDSPVHEIWRTGLALLGRSIRRLGSRPTR
jgi:hypothetical protein